LITRNKKEKAYSDIIKRNIKHLVFVLFLLGVLPVFSQIMVSSSHKPLSMTICESDSTFSLLIANTSGSTVSGAVLALDLPSSCRYIPGSIVNATELNITNLNQPTFSLPNILNNTTHNVDYNAEIICGYDNTENFNYTVNHNNLAYTGFDSPLQNYYYPSIVITSITNSSATVQVNQSVIRDFTIEQQGLFASLDTLVVIDQHTTDIEVLNVSVGTLIKDLGPGPILFDTIIITGSDMPGGNNKFDYGETIVLSETVKLVGCDNGQSTINATWGCYGDYCEDHFAYPSVSPASGVPLIDITFTGNNRGWGFIDNSGFIEFTVTNNGTGAGTAFDMVTLGGFSTGGGTYYPNGDWLNEVDSFSVNGNYSKSFFNYAAGATNGRYAYYFNYPFTFDPDGPGVGIEDVDGDGFYDDLPVGNSVTVKAHTYYNWNEAVANIPTTSLCGRGWTNNYWQAFRFGYDLTDQCSSQPGATWIPNTNTLLFHTYNTRSLEHTIPADIYDGTTVWMEQQVSTNTIVTDEGCPNDSVIYTIVLPDGIVVAGGTATYRGVSMGAPLINGNTVTYFLNKDKVKWGGWFKVPLQTDCDVSHNPTATIQTSLRFWCDKTLFPARYFTYWCSESPVFGIQCPLGACVDPYVSDFTVERTTMGWVDNQLSKKVDKETPGIQLDYAMARDSIKISTTGVINENTDSLYFILHHDNILGNWSNQLFFNYITDTLEFYDVETATWLYCHNMNPVITDGSISELSLNISNLTNTGGCFDGYTFTSGDSLRYSIYGQVKDIERSQWETVPGFRSHFYNIKDNKEEYCNDRGATFNIVGSSYTFSNNTYINPTIVEGCDDLQFYGQIYRWLDDCGGLIAFPNEVRPYVVLDTLIFYIPENIVYQPGTSVHRYRYIDGSFESETVSDPVIEYIGGITKLTYVRDINWSYSAYWDCSRDEDRIQFYATAGCHQESSIAYSISTSGRYQFYADGLGINHNNTASTSKPYLHSEVSMTPLITTAEGRYDTVFWDVRLCNITNIDTYNNWLGFESLSEGIEVIEIIDITVPASPVTIPVSSYGPGNRWAQLGTLVGNQCNIYQVKAIYSSCSSDSLYVRHAFNCAGYPVNPQLGYPPTAYSCIENNTYLYLEPNDVSLNLAVSSPVNPLSLCDTLQYEAEISNTLLSYAYNLSLTVSVPPGVSILPSTSEFSYPYNSGVFEMIDDPVNSPVGSNNWVYNLSADTNATEILKGVDSIPYNGYKLKYKIITDCDLISGSSMKVTATASNACGSVKNRSSFSSPIIINGLPTNVNLYVLSTEADNYLPTCNVSSTVKTKIINLGPNSASDIELLSISIDDAYDYVPGSLIPIHNGPSGISSNIVYGGVRFISFSIQPNLAINDSIVFTYELIDVDPGSLVCDTIPLTTNAMLVASVPCSTAPGGSCEIQSITSSLVNNMSVRKDDVVFGSIDATSIPSGNNAEQVTINYSIVNSGYHPFHSDSLDIVFVHDANGNGIADDSGPDSLFYQRLGVENLPVGDSVDASVIFTAGYDKICSMLAAIRISEDTCICSETSVSISNIHLQNAGEDTSVCVQNTLEIGFDSIQGQSYIWVPSVYLNSSTISNPEFFYTGSLTQPDTLTYILITDRSGECLSQDSIQIIIYPFAEAFAGSDEIICESFPFDFATSTILPTASNFDSIRWYGGTGTFSDPHSIYPVYNPGVGELGDVELFLIAYSMLNCSQDIASMILTIDSLPDPDFTYAPDDNICVNEPIAFSGFNNNNTIITNWLWDFGDGSLSTGQIADHFFTSDGIFNVKLIITNNHGCIDSITKTIVVNELPVADFTINPPDTACADIEVFFDATSTPNIVDWDWNFGDNSGGSGQNTSHIYYNPGSYLIELQVQNDNTCRDTVVDSIYIRPLPSATIMVSSADTSCLNDTVYFEGNSSDNIISWNWDFGDGGIATGQSVEHVYTLPGIYYYTVVFIDINSCTDTISDSLFIRLPQTADFVYSPSDTSCVNETVSFSGQSQNNIIDWYWEFGDGNTGSGQVAMHDYQLPGTYDVSLIFTDLFGCIDTVVHQVIVDDPQIGINIFPSPICFGDTTYFESTGDNITYAPYNWNFGDGIGIGSGYNTSYLYTQPGTFDVSLQVCSKNVVQTHTVNPVCVVDAGGNQATCQDVYFNYTNSATPPTASGYDSVRWTTSGIGYFNDPTLVTPTYFPDSTEGKIQNDTLYMRMVGYGIPPCDNDTSYMYLIVIPGAFAEAGSDETACINEPYDFANSIDSAFATHYIALSWYTTGTGYFIDPNVMRPVYIPGQDELGPITMTMIATNIINCDSIDDMTLTYHPTYVVPVDITVCNYDSIFAEGEWHYSSGTYYDTLLSYVGCDSVIVTNLIVRPKIDKDFYVSSGDSLCIGETVSFIPTGSANIINQLWDFGNGTTSTEISPLYQYDSIGNYTVIYYYTDDNGCSDSAYRDITVFELPDVSFDINQDNACVNYPVEFTGSSNSNIAVWNWDFGDGQTGSGQIVSHTYLLPGEMTITLTVTDVAGCSETTSENLLVLQASNAEFTFDFFACDSTQFTDLSTAPEGYNIVMWHWDFGDGDTSDLQNPVHVFPTNNIPGGVTYDVSLVITSDSVGYICSSMVTHQVLVQSNPDIFFNWNPEPTCLGGITNFYGGSGFYIDQWHWDFDDGNFSLDQNPTHIYADTGFYNVILTISDTNQCVNSMSNLVSVIPVPEVSFTMSDTVLCHGNALQLNATGSQGIAQWHWDFGDGGFSNLQNPFHYYLSEGTYLITLTATDSAGCSGTATDQILILPEPVADFEYQNYTCATILFNDLSTAPVGYNIVEWQWDFGDGFSATVQNPSHNYSSGAGVYDVTLIVTADSAGYGCMDTIIQTVYTTGLPSVYFTWDPEPTTLGNQTNFYGTSGNSVIDWYWDFDDGNFAVVQEPVHTYNSSGIFSVKLTITDIDGCQNTVMHDVTVSLPPDLDFEWNYSCEGDPVQFNILSPPTDIPAVESWSWTFGDGGLSSDMEPLHIYTSSGNYNVSLTIVDTSGAMATLIKEIFVAPPPVALFSFSNPTCVDNSIQFFDHSSTSTGNITRWSWDFGDGNSQTIDFPDNPDVEHSYSSLGNYDVILTVINSDSCHSNYQDVVTVNSSPEAMFDYNSSCAGNPINFADNSLENGGGAIIAWNWNFGDPSSGNENTSNLINPSHIYSTPGDYDVILVVTNINDCSDSTTITVAVAEEPEVDFTFTDACLGLDTEFTSETDNSILEYSWSFGDGNSSQEPNPTHQYGAAGNYSVTLSILTTDSCVATETHIVEVNPLPVPDFSNSSPACLNNDIEFTDLSVSPNGLIDTWEWDFGDGNTITITAPDNPNVTHLYDSDGTYTVVLSVIDDQGCENNVSKDVAVVSSPLADFSFEELCFNEPVLFTDISSTNGGTDIQSWLWYFGDPASGSNNTSNLQNPTHIYSAPGTFSATLIVNNITGCSDTIDQEVEVDSLVFVDFTISDDSICLGELAEFTGIGTNISTWYWEFGDGGISIEQNPSYMYSAPGEYLVTLTVTETGEDCESTVSSTIVVSGKPQAYFEYDNACLGDSTYFTDLSFSQYGFITAWNWDFGDGNTSTLEDPTHMYQANTGYQVTLIVSDNYGCSDTIEQFIEIFDSPIPAFSWNQVCDPVGRVYFFDESQPGGDGSPIIGWNWEFDNGNYSTEIDPGYTFPETDSCYTVFLTVMDNNGCSAMDSSDQICLFGSTIIDFVSTEVCFGEPTTFEVNSIPGVDSIVSYTWSFNDGSQEITTEYDTISHVFTHPGTIIVKLSVVDTMGCNTILYKEVDVDSLPVAQFNNTTGSCGNPVQFTDMSLEGGAPLDSWYWDFGDISSGSNNTSTDQNPEHAYGLVDSSYHVKLVTTNTFGCVDSIIKDVVIEPCLVANFTIDSSVCARSEVTIIDLSVFHSDQGIINSWSWIFGDGASANYSIYQDTIVHTFNTSGNYNVQLIVHSIVSGASYYDTISKLIMVMPSPDAMFSFDNTCLGDTVDFFDESITHGSDILTWNWSFGDNTFPGNTSGQNPSYFYPQFGTYEVSLKTINELGCSDSLLKNISIHKLPVADFSFENTCMNYYTYFFDESESDSAEIINYLWDFGNLFNTDDTSIVQNPVYIYDTVGNFTVYLQVEDDNYCNDTISKQLEVYPVPISDFLIIDTNRQGQIYLQNMSDGALNYYWDFNYNYGESSTETSPIHQFDNDGLYRIMLVSYNEYSCPDTAYHDYEILFTNLFVPNAFVPSSDLEELQTFKPVGVNLVKYKLSIYSSWGNLVFESTKLSNGIPAEGWDGKYNGEELPSGSYIWTISAMFKDRTIWTGTDNGDGNKNTGGTITLIR